MAWSAAKFIALALTLALFAIASVLLRFWAHTKTGNKPGIDDVLIVPALVSDATNPSAKRLLTVAQICVVGMAAAMVVGKSISNDEMAVVSLSSRRRTWRNGSTPNKHKRSRWPDIHETASSIRKGKDLSQPSPQLLTTAGQLYPATACSSFPRIYQVLYTMLLPSRILGLSAVPVR